MLTYNNTKIETLKFGSTDIETGLFNGVTVFEKRQENIVILRTTQPTLRLSVFTKEGLDVDVWNAGEKVAVLGNTGRVDFRLKDTGQDVIIKGHDIIKLFCNENQLTSLNAQGCTALQELYCYNTQLTSLNVQGCTALQGLHCNDNQLTSLNAQGLTVLQRLLCYNNQLTAHAFKDIFINLAKTKWEGISILYKDRDSNYSDFTQPPELAAAFNAAKAKGWKFYKNDTNSSNVL